MFDTTEEQFDQFINMVAPLVKNVRMIEYMRKIHRKTSPAFLESVQFHKLLESQRKHVETDSANIFVHLREFCTELKAYRVEAKKRKLDSDDERTGTDTNGVASSQNDDEPVSKSFKVNDAYDLPQVNASVENTANGSSPNVARDSLCDRIESTSVEGNHEDVASSSTCNQADYVEVLHSVAGPSYAAIRVEAATATTGKSEKKKVSDRQVRKFEKLLKVWNMLCELKGRTSETGRYMEKRFRYEGSRYHEVNRSVERFINKKKIFPDFHDICRVVDKLLDTEIRRLQEKEMSLEDMDSDASYYLREEQLKKRFVKGSGQGEEYGSFKLDYVSGIFYGVPLMSESSWQCDAATAAIIAARQLPGCHLTDVAAATAGEEGAAAMDPAEESEELRQALDRSVLDKYEQKEVELGLQPEEVSISGEVDSSSDDAEEKEDVVDDDDEDTEQADTSRDSHADEDEEEEEDGEVSESEEEDSSTGIAGIDSQSAEDEVEQEEEEEDESELEEEAEDAMEEEEAEKSVSDDIEGTSNDVTATEENPHAIGVEKLTAATSEDSTEFSGSASCQQVPTNYIANADVPSGATSGQCRTTTAGSAEEELGGATSGSSQNGGEVATVKHEIATRGRSGSDGDAGTSMCTSDPAENATRGRSRSDGDEETSPSSPEAMPIILQEMLRADQSEAGGGSRRPPVGGTTVEVIELLDSDSDVESNEVRHEGAPAGVRAARPESERTSAAR
ncbi:PREDICTED: death domain-associated protein 6-like [Priapulus caudatus]|uniref:Death domain-associated protein 6-like n=1 Tax=Priapulus caudatus TaxID=37621 RepID=A0ABM1EU28_PRICU|nr:PREDICTED: death domain-associated protein 6-like [Priapulus caudatus]